MTQETAANHGAVPPNPDSVMRTVAKARSSPLRRWLTRLGILLALGGAGAGVWAYRQSQAVPEGPAFATKPAKLGDLEATVTATGNLRGIDTVQIGAETTGRVKSVKVKFNDPVEEGQVLAEVDPEQLLAQRAQSLAQVASAQAEIASRKSSLAEVQQKAKRAQELAGRGLLSQQELETAVAAVEQAEAALKASGAQLAVAQANVSATETQLKKATIKAPMSGVVLDRTVEVGQTLNSQFSTPVLFTLSKDLKEMELVVGIDEADIGQVAPGQTAVFNVDAYPNRPFSAAIKTIRNIATMVENVVTYEAVLSVDNAERLLRPGMTATVTIVTTSKKNVLLVPNSALRFTPPEADRGPRLPFGAGRVGPRPSAEAPAKLKPSQHKVYVDAGGTPKAIVVTTGLTDGEFTEIVEGDLEPGTELITEALQAR